MAEDNYESVDEKIVLFLLRPVQHVMLNLLLISIFVVCQIHSGIAGHPVVLMVLDGFRHDYLSVYSTPNLDQILKDGGVLAPRLQAEFPSFTETFLTSLLTGHHTEDHGILANEVFFESLQSPLSIDDFNFWNSTRKLQTLWDLVPQFYTCNWPYAEHIVNHEDQDHILSSHNSSISISNTKLEDEENEKEEASPLGNAKNITQQTIQNATDATTTVINHSEDQWEQCFLKMMQKLNERQKNDESMIFSLYMDEPGKTIKMYGPDSPEVASAIEKMDNTIGQLLGRLKEKKLWSDRINFILTSTPGYVTFSSSSSYDHLIDLKTILKNPNVQYQAIGESPVLNIKPLDKELMVYEELKKGEESGGYRVYIKEEFPPTSHYAANENVQELILVANEGYAFSYDMRNRIQELDQMAHRNESLSNKYGISGYNNTLESMMSFVIVHGPDMANKNRHPHDDDDSNDNSEVISVLDIYEIICQLLDVQKVPNSAAGGNAKRAASLLLRPSEPKVVKVIRNWISYALLPENVPITIAIGCFFIAMLFLLIVCIVCISRRQQKCCGRNKDALPSTGYRYTQVKNNRRPDDDSVDVHFEGINDDKQALLTEVAILDEEETEA